VLPFLQALAACMHALQLAEEDADGAHSRQYIVAALMVNAGPPSILIMQPVNAEIFLIL